MAGSRNRMPARISANWKRVRTCSPKGIFRLHTCRSGTLSGTEPSAAQECIKQSLFPTPASAGLPRQIFDNFVNRETQDHPRRFLTFVCIIRKTLNQRSLLFRAPTQIAWRPHCMVRVCKRSWSSTAIAMTNRWFT